jgi:hypothetical protein
MKIAVIPDTQCKPGIKFDHLRRVGQYIADKHPDRIIHLGDHWDMESLTSYDKPSSKSYVGRNYKKDVAAGIAGMETLMGPIGAEIARTNGAWSPELDFFMGNHEYRIERAIDANPGHLEGLMGYDALRLEEFGWTVHPFLKTKVIGGVVFAHYVTSGVMGKPITTAAALLSKGHMSTVVGHQQGKQIAYGKRADGRSITGVIVGSCYEHNEAFMGPQGNKHWRGMLMMHQVKQGQFDEMPVSLSYLKLRYK